MTNLKNFFYLLLSSVLFSCGTSEKNRIASILTNDSVGYWKQEYFHHNYAKEYRQMILYYAFYKDGRCENYWEKDPPIKNVQGGNYGALKWFMDTDTTINIFCSDTYKILYTSQDTIILEEKYNKSLHRFTRSKEKWTFDQAAIQYRDSLDAIYSKKQDPCQFDIYTDLNKPQ